MKPISRTIHIRGGFRNLIFTLVTLLTLLTTKTLLSQGFESKDMCYNCHTIIESKFKEPAILYKNDIHFRKGITCAACHGGDASSDDQDVAMSTIR